jgi:hypothetical protein
VKRIRDAAAQNLNHKQEGYTMKWLRFFALALVLVTGLGVLQLAAQVGLGIQLRLSASAVGLPDVSHTITVEWGISGGTNPLQIKVELTDPSGQVQAFESDTAREGKYTFEVNTPQGGSASVQINVKDAASATASASGSASLSRTVGQEQGKLSVKAVVERNGEFREISVPIKVTEPAGADERATAFDVIAKKGSTVTVEAPAEVTIDGGKLSFRLWIWSAPGGIDALAYSEPKQSFTLNEPLLIQNLEARYEPSGALFLPPLPPVFPTAPNPNSYVVVTLDSVTIHDDEDPFGSGEVVLMTATASAGKVQQIHWPGKHWQDANSGETLLDLAKAPTVPKKLNDLNPVLAVTREQEAIPIFAMKESEMGRDLAIFIMAVDDDQIKDWLKFLIEKGMAKAAGLVAEWAGGGPLAQEGAEFIGGKIGEALVEWLSQAEEIGIHVHKFSKEQDWGVGQTHEFRAKGMTVRYTIRRVTPPEMRLSVFLRAVVTHDSSEPWYRGDGDCYLFARAAMNFVGNELNTTPFSRNDDQTPDCNDGTVLRFDQELRTEGGIWPFLYVEVAVLEDDSPADDDDTLAIAAFTVFPWLDPTLAEPRGERVTRTYGVRYNNGSRGGGSATIIFQIVREPY